MKLVVVSIKDAALGAYSRPAFVPTVGAAQRSFMDEINNPQSEAAKHPKDYDLYLLGYFDDVTGQFSNEESPKILLRGFNCVEKKG